MKIRKNIQNAKYTLTEDERKTLNSVRSGKSAPEIFNDIAKTIQNSHKDNITEKESRKIARNFINFCKKLVEIEVRIDEEKSNISKNCN